MFLYMLRVYNISQGTMTHTTGKENKLIIIFKKPARNTKLGKISRRRIHPKQQTRLRG